MNLGLLFLKVNTLGVITLSELDWITNHQSEFSRLDMALVIKIGRLMDSGVVEIDNRLPVWFLKKRSSWVFDNRDTDKHFFCVKNFCKKKKKKRLFLS